MEKEKRFIDAYLFPMKISIRSNSLRAEFENFILFFLGNFDNKGLTFLHNVIYSWDVGCRGRSCSDERVYMVLLIHEGNNKP